jgi:Na+-driven multidrug efflux pump
VVTVLGSVAMGLGVGASSVIARAMGEGDHHKVKKLTTNSLTLSLLIVGILIVVGLATIELLFSALGTKPEVLSLVGEYMTIWYTGMIFLVIPMVGNSAIRASGNTLVPSLIMTFAAAVNIGLDPIFIFGWGFIPALGLGGAAIATVIARATTLVASLSCTSHKECCCLICPISGGLGLLEECFTCGVASGRHEYDYPHLDCSNYQLNVVLRFSGGCWFWHCLARGVLRLGCADGSIR